MTRSLSAQAIHDSARHPAIAAALKSCRRVLLSVALFSAVVNLLMLAGPLYMLQVYDRVLASHSVPTLFALSILLVGALALQSVVDVIRNRLVTRSAGYLDQHLSAAAHAAVFRLSITGQTAGKLHEPVRELDQLRTFLTGQGPIAIADLPWIPVFLLICGLIHPWLGIIALAGGITLIGAMLLTECASRAPSREANRSARARSRMVEEHRRNAETTTAMGMEATLSRRWLALNAGYLAAAARAADAVGFYAGLSRMTRMMLQSAALGVGAYLVIRHELMPGAMIAASITMARALAPIETVIANWRGLIAARDSMRKMTRTLAWIGVDPERMALPRPQHSLVAEDLVAAAPDRQTAIVGPVSFAVTAGTVLGIIGPSGSGKTSLVRVIVGVWRPAQGTVRIDGATLEQYPPEILGRDIGYLPQSVDLFHGTVGENIARMAPEPDDAAVIAAAQAAGAHEMILRLPKGYDTLVGHGGAVLSAGQRQRVALARAIYGDPFLIVLDEPNANLDAEGEAALQRAILNARARGAIVVLIAHRAGMLSVCDTVLVLREGTQHAFGPRDAVLRDVTVRPAAAAARFRVVGTAATVEEEPR